MSAQDARGPKEHEMSATGVARSRQDNRIQYALLAEAEAGTPQGVGHRVARSGGLGGRRAGLTAPGSVATFRTRGSCRLGAGLVVEPQRQADALARLVHVEDLHT